MTDLRAPTEWAGSLRVGVRTGRGVLRWIWTHPANRGRRVRQVLHAARFQLGGRLSQKPLVTPLGARSRIFASIGDSGASSVVYANPPNYDEMTFWAGFLRPDDLFVDVGANIGSYTVLACEQGAQVIAVEPHPLTRSKLQENLALNGYRAVVVPAVVGATVGTAVLTADRDTTNHVINEPSEPDSSATIEVASTTIDIVIGDRHARGIKIDVEGFERTVVEGASAALAHHRIDVLQLEWNEMSEAHLGEDRSQLAARLRAHGYVLLRPDGTSVDGSVGADVFAASPGALRRVRVLLGSGDGS